MIDTNGWQNLIPEESFPEHLRSYEALEQHFRANLEGLSTTVKGYKFALAVQKVVPQTDAGADFTLPVLNEKKSNDEGVDMTARGKENRSKVLYIQSRLWIDRAEKVDSVISNFQAFTEDQQTPNVNGQLMISYDNEPPHFLLITLSPLKGILKRYEKRSFSSREFYRQCLAEQRISFIDGYQILSILRAAYIKVNEPPTQLVLNFETPVISKENVFIGIMSSSEIQSLYSEFNDALFFENVREFQGVTLGRERSGRATPNDEIVKTVTTEPNKMLPRNNGVVFKANSVRVSDDLRKLTLSKGSLVNGCQTAICLVEYAKEPCYVSVKVVETSDAWDITKAANNQNYVDQIDLDLARHVRPQLMRRAAANLGVRLADNSSMFQIIDEIYNRRVVYEEVRLLYIGLFSRSPNNILAANYTELLPKLSSKFYDEDENGTKTFETLFELQWAAQEGIEVAKKTFTNTSYASMFDRLYSEHNLAYRCFISILALCGVINTNLAERKEGIAEFERMKKFFADATFTLENQKKEFLRYYLLAVKVWMDEVAPTGAEALEIRRDMSRESKRANFTGLYLRVCREADLNLHLERESR